MVLKWWGRAREKGSRRRPVVSCRRGQLVLQHFFLQLLSSLLVSHVAFRAESLNQFPLCLTLIYVSISCEQTLVWPNLVGREMIIAAFKFHQMALLLSLLSFFIFPSVSLSSSFSFFFPFPPSSVFLPLLFILCLAFVVLHNIQWQNYSLACVFPFQLLVWHRVWTVSPKRCYTSHFPTLFFLCHQSHTPWNSLTKYRFWATWWLTQCNNCEWCFPNVHTRSFISQLSLQLDGSLGMRLSS